MRSHLISQYDCPRCIIPKKKKPQNVMFHGFQCGVRSLTIYHDKVTTQEQRTRNNFGNRLFFCNNTLRYTPVRAIPCAKPLCVYMNCPNLKIRVLAIVCVSPIICL